MTSRPPTPVRCRRCGGDVYPTAQHCPHCGGPGPGPGSAWLRRSRWVANAAMVVVLGAIGLTFALGYVASWIGGDAEGVAYFFGMLVGMPAFLLLVPVLLVVAGLDYAGNRAYRGESIAASWDVRLDGEDHVVSLPATRISSPDHAWVDGVRIPIVWTPTGAGYARAMLDGGTLSGTLSTGIDRREVAATVGLFALLLVATGTTTAGGPGPAIPSRSRVRPSRPSRSVTGNAGPRRGNWPAVPAGGLTVEPAGGWRGSPEVSQRRRTPREGGTRAQDRCGTRSSGFGDRVLRPGPIQADCHVWQPQIAMKRSEGERWGSPELRPAGPHPREEVAVQLSGGR